MRGSLRLRAAFRVFRKSSTKISNCELLSQLFLLINEFFIAGHSPDSRHCRPDISGNLDV